MAIQNKPVGNHGDMVSNLRLGTMNFGWKTDQEESFKIMDRALVRPALLAPAGARSSGHLALLDPALQETFSAVRSCHWNQSPARPSTATSCPSETKVTLASPSGLSLI